MAVKEWVLSAWDVLVLVVFATAWDVLDYKISRPIERRWRTVKYHLMRLMEPPPGMKLVRCHKCRRPMYVDPEEPHKVVMEHGLPRVLWGRHEQDGREAWHCSFLYCLDSYPTRWE